jgi:T-complex protein 1 subunit theta
MALSVALQQRQQAGTGIGAVRARRRKSLEVVPRTLAERCGLERHPRPSLDCKPRTVNLNTNAGGEICAVGVNERDGMDDDGVAGAGTADIQTVGVDLLAMKLSAIRFAVDAPTTILKVDQIIMSKQSGGPQ